MRVGLANILQFNSVVFDLYRTFPHVCPFYPYLCGNGLFRILTWICQKYGSRVPVERKGRAELRVFNQCIAEGIDREGGSHPKRGWD
jgi:hypothetical protein